MKHRSFFIDLILTYFVVVTLITLAMAVLGLLFDKNRTFGYEVLFSPLIYGLLSILPNVLLYSKKELTIRQMLVRKLLQLVLIELLLIGLIIFGGVYDIKLIVPLAAAIVIVFFSATFILWILDLRSARELNKELAQYQKSLNN